MRTLSARILVGFAALTVTFGIITAILVFNTQTVEDEIELVRKGYVPLSLVTKDLARREEDLKAYIWDGLKDEPNAYSAHTNLRNTRNRRNTEINATRKILDSLEQLPDFDARQFAVTRARVDALETAIAVLAPTYDALARAGDLEAPEVAASLDELRRGERAIWVQTNDLANALGTRVGDTTRAVERNEHTLRIYTIYLGLTAVVLGLLITIWVVITLRPLGRLRDAARQIASGDYGSRIAEGGPSEVADLAREFNSMGRAVQEREEEKLRAARLAMVGKMAAQIAHEVRNPLS